MKLAYTGKNSSWCEKVVENICLYKYYSKGALSAVSSSLFWFNL